MRSVSWGWRDKLLVSALFNEGKTDATLGFKDIMACRINESFQVDRDFRLISTELSLLKVV